MELLAETPEKVTEGSTKLFGCLDVAQGMQLSRPKANVSAFFGGKPKLTDAGKTWPCVFLGKALC